MIARIFRLSTALFVSAAAWLHQPAATISCGFAFEGNNNDIRCFDPRVLPDSLFDGYFRFAIGNGSGMKWEFLELPEDTVARADRNIDDWSTYLGGRLPALDIAAFVYKDSLSHLERLIAAMRDGDEMPPWPVGGGRLTAADIMRRGDTAMLRYMIFAKICEPYVFAGTDEWSDAQPPTSAEILRILERGRAEVAECRDDRLRVRYGYQLVRLAHYSGLWQNAVDLYDTLIAPNGAQLAVRQYSMLNRSGALGQLGRKAESLYLNAMVFDRALERRWPALMDFTIPSETTWDSAYAMARSDHERSVLWMMRGMSEYRLDTRPLDSMMALEPRDPRIDVMLVREVREVERKLANERLTRPAWTPIRRAGFGTSVVDLKEWGWERSPEDSAIDQRYPARLARLAERSADRGRVSNPALWYAVAGYMRILMGDIGTADRDLDRAGRALTEGGPLQDQIHILRLVARSRSDRPLPVDVASLHTAALAWFDSSSADEYTPMPEVPAVTLLGRKFLLQGDIPRAAAAFVRGGNRLAANAVLDIYATDGDLLKLQRLLERPRRRAIDTFLFDRFPLGATQIIDLRATRMMRRGRFAQAVKLWDQLYRSSRDTTSAGDTLSPEMIDLNGMFTATIDTTLPHETDSSYRPMRREVTRSAFARRMLEFERRAARSRPERVRYEYAIARALRSAPYWGYARQVWDGSLTWSFSSAVRPIEFPFNHPAITRRMIRAQVAFLREYGSNEIALRYFQRVRRATDSRELAAIVTYEMDEARNKPLTSMHTKPITLDRTSYNLLRTRYRETVVAKRALSNCLTYEYFRTHR